ncbi:MAG: helix-turn-helix domain-containing protein [Cyclobacteriaceae bacterium]
MNNPYEHIDQRLDQIESLILEIRSGQLSLPKHPNPNERLTRRKVREEYSVSYATIHKLMRSGDLKYEKIGRKTLFRRESVEACFSGSKVA